MQRTVLNNLPLPRYCCYATQILLPLLLLLPQIKSCSHPLNWSPDHIKTGNIFTTFANEVNCASWKTTSPGLVFSPTGKSHLSLPSGIPFSFICGACYLGKKLPGTLALEAPSDLKTSFETLKTSGSDNREHSKGDIRCLVSYGQTEALHQNGFLKCLLERGQQKQTEEISYEVREVPIETETIKKTIHDGMVQLNCSDANNPEKFSTSKDLFHVWHFLDSSSASSSSEAIVTTSMKSSISFRQTQKTSLVACSIFNPFNLEKVWQTSYELKEGPKSSRQSQKPELNKDGGTNDEEEAEEEVEEPILYPLTIFFILLGTLVATVIFVSIVCYIRRNDPE